MPHLTASYEDKSIQLNAIDNRDHDYLRKSEFGGNMMTAVADITIGNGKAVNTLYELFRIPRLGQVHGITLRATGAVPINGSRFDVGRDVFVHNTERHTRAIGNETQDQGFDVVTVVSSNSAYGVNWQPIYQETLKLGINEESAHNSVHGGLTLSPSLTEITSIYLILRGAATTAAFPMSAMIQYSI